ncbi:MAG: hypothetical protein ABFS18_13715, partial [Thermodesulfobacteriota bacterium]
MKNIILFIAIAIAIAMTMSLGLATSALADSWVSDTSDTNDTSCIDWYDTEHDVLVVGDYVKISNVYYHVYSAAGNSPWQGGNTGLNSVCLQQVNQTDGTLQWVDPWVPAKADMGNQVTIEWWPHTVKKDSSPSYMHRVDWPFYTHGAANPGEYFKIAGVYYAVNASGLTDVGGVSYHYADLQQVNQDTGERMWSGETPVWADDMSSTVGLPIIHYLTWPSLPAWPVFSIWGTPGAEDWLDWSTDDHAGPVNEGEFLEIEGVFYSAFETIVGSWSGVDFVSTQLRNIDQYTGELLPDVWSPIFGEFVPDLGLTAGMVGKAIVHYATWEETENTWKVNSISSADPSAIDWLASVHAVVPVNYYLEIGNTTYSVFAAADGSWNGTGAFYKLASLQQVDQKNGARLMRPPPNETDELMADMRPELGSIISSHADWSTTDADHDGVEYASDICWGDDATGDTDSDGDCDDEDLDDDNDGVLDVNDDCATGDLGWISDAGTDYDGDGCQDSSTEDTDDDNDGFDDGVDLDAKNETVCADADLDTCDDCTNGADLFDPAANNDVANDGADLDSDGICDAGDLDDDNDGVLDVDDDCALGDLGWLSGAGTDYDGDGCQDSSTEDTDDDNDGFTDGVDLDAKNETVCADADLDTCDDCTNGADSFDPAANSDVANDGADFDSDGTCDAGDLDDDNDGVLDVDDDCATGDLGWLSGAGTDYDGDGCQDSLEDLDDDNDSVVDTSDDCAKGDLDWISDQATTDHDTDGCQDSLEDTDDDNDSIADLAPDLCPKGDLGWTSDPLTNDHDSDGCQDATEDFDADNDGVLDVNDDCATGDLGWTSNGTTDYDTDGCQDATVEDLDDDNDGVVDTGDDCAKGDLGWTSNGTTDYDTDGCQDATVEDLDDDNDGVVDTGDDCAKGDLGWTSNGTTDYDTDGCQDATVEDLDDDNDGVVDTGDDCAK